jgi:hypothetical protein
MSQTRQTTSQFTRPSRFWIRWRVSGSCLGTEMTRIFFSSGLWNSRKGTWNTNNGDHGNAEMRVTSVHRFERKEGGYIPRVCVGGGGGASIIWLVKINQAFWHKNDLKRGTEMLVMSLLLVRFIYSSVSNRLIQWDKRNIYSLGIFGGN